MPAVALFVFQAAARHIAASDKRAPAHQIYP
jgi:hypothetical protein